MKRKITTKNEQPPHKHLISPDNLLQPAFDQQQERESPGQTSSGTCRTGPQTFLIYLLIHRLQPLLKHYQIYERILISQMLFNIVHGRSLHVAMELCNTGPWNATSEVQPINVLGHNEFHLNILVRIWHQMIYSNDNMRIVNLIPFLSEQVLPKPCG